MTLPKRPAMVREAAEKCGWKWYLEILIFVVVFLVTQLIEGIPIVFLDILRGGFFFFSDEPLPDWYMIATLFITGLGTVTVILFCRMIQKRDLRSMGFQRENAVREYLLGALFGIVLFSASVLICVLTGTVTLSAQPFSVGIWILYLIGFLIQGMSEEVL